MPRSSEKRKADEANIETKTSPPKFMRGERFGESTDLFPLSQLSQVADADFEDDEAAEELQGSGQDAGSVSSNMLYGTSTSLSTHSHHPGVMSSNVIEQASWRAKLSESATTEALQTSASM